MCGCEKRGLSIKQPTDQGRYEVKQERPYWNMDFETKLNTPEMREIQWLKLTKKLE